MADNSVPFTVLNDADDVRARSCAIALYQHAGACQRNGGEAFRSAVPRTGEES